ncbi:MAG: carbon storage regulator CsrA [Lentisphaeria bacterium]|nr:carbon storage regulator CsrA [Lentisphaeria bacterium]
MLILMRRLNESIMIGDDIEIRVLKIQGGQVHLGIDAPREVSVYRKEIWESMQKEAKESSTHDE